jgi:tetratricopeptide (TPR) repeat protein
MPAVLGLLLFAQVAAGVAAPPDGSELVSFAAASPRPPECGAPAGRGAASVWNRAREPKLRTYCDALARGYASLRRSPADALAAAARASAALPGRAAPAVLEARALVRQGRHAEAWKRFEAARAISPRSVDSPHALHDFAIAALSTGKLDEARAAYRVLAPRADLLGAELLRQRVYVEAAAAMMTAGSESLGEAIGYLAEARRRSTQPGFSPVVLGVLALALDRQGRSDEARGVAAEAGGSGSLVRAEARDRPAPGASGKPAAMPLLPEGELDAIIAILAERSEPELARERWQTFLDGAASRGPWADHARKKLEALRARRGKGR